MRERVAIVTGAGGGFGKGIAAVLAARGAKVVVADIREGAANDVADEIVRSGGQATAVAVDVTLGQSVKAMVECARNAYGGLDILVNNAGTTHKNQHMLDVGENEFDRVYAVNVKSIYLATIHAVPELRKSKSGVIVNIASAAGVRPRPGLTWYAGSKAAAISITRSMALELAPDRIRVCAVNPVMGETGLIGEFLPGEDTAETRTKVLAGIPLGRFATPTDIANAVAFLASEQASMITGVALVVDGGRCV